MIDKMNKNGLVPYLVVLRILPHFHLINSNILEQNKRMIAITCIRREIETLVAQKRLRTGLKLNIPSACNKNYSIGERVIISKSEKQHGVGPTKSQKKNDKQFHVDKNSSMIQFLKSQVKLFTIGTVEGSE